MTFNLVYYMAEVQSETWAWPFVRTSFPVWGQAVWVSIPPQHPIWRHINLYHSITSADHTVLPMDSLFIFILMVR